jgi:hypothetical protein
MTTTEILGVSGFGLTLAHICWQVWWQHRQNREHVRAEIPLAPSPHVKVHNIGVMPVHLTGVRLVTSREGLRKDYPFQTVVVHQCLPTEAGRLGKEVWQLVGRATYPEPLQRGDAYSFVLPNAAAPVEELLANARHLKMWISVYSNAGEVYRLKQKQVLRLLQALGKDGNRGTAAPVAAGHTSNGPKGML